METNGRGRRRFFGKLSRVVAGIGGLIASGVVPELRAATQAPTPIPTSVLLPEAPELPLVTANSLYTQALSDSDVALLMASLGSQGRLDPPAKSFDVSLDAGNRAQTVSLPVRSYADGSTLAYICYGVGNSTASDGSTASLPIRGMVTAAGSVHIAGGGRMADSPKPEYNEVIFASMFPDLYFQSHIVAASAGTALRRKTLGEAWSPRFLRKVWQGVAPPDKRSQCIAQCNINWQTCLNTPLVSTATGGVVGFWCMICLGLATGATIITIGGAAPTLAACLTPCAISAAALTAAAVTLANCNSTARACFAMCDNIPPGQPI
jgi:hypothetical protein